MRDHQQHRCQASPWCRVQRCRVRGMKNSRWGRSRGPQTRRSGRFLWPAGVKIATAYSSRQYLGVSSNIGKQYSHIWATSNRLTRSRLKSCVGLAGRERRRKDSGGEYSQPTGLMVANYGVELTQSMAATAMHFEAQGWPNIDPSDPSKTPLELAK